MIGAHVARARDQHRAVSLAGDEALGHLRVARALRRHHARHQRVGQRAAVDRANLVLQRRLRGRRPVERVAPYKRGIERGEVAACDRAHGRRRQVGGDDGQSRGERRDGDRLVETPVGPARGAPAHRVAEPRGVARRRGEVARERGRLRGVQHLEGEGGAAAALDHPPQQPRLELVVLGVVVALAQQRKARRAHRGRERGHRHEPAVRDVPDPPGERVVVPESWRRRLGCARDGRDGKDQRKDDEPAGHEISIPRGRDSLSV